MEMSIEEIILGLELTSHSVPCYTACRNRGMSDDEAEVFVNKAVNAASEALEKLRPKMPVAGNNNGPDAYTACPFCEAYLEEYQQFCTECGQALDWGDER